MIQNSYILDYVASPEFVKSMVEGTYDGSCGNFLNGAPGFTNLNKVLMINSCDGLLSLWNFCTFYSNFVYHLILIIKRGQHCCKNVVVFLGGFEVTVLCHGTRRNVNVVHFNDRDSSLKDLYAMNLNLYGKPSPGFSTTLWNSVECR